MTTDENEPMNSASNDLETFTEFSQPGGSHMTSVLRATTKESGSCSDIPDDTQYKKSSLIRSSSWNKLRCVIQCARVVHLFKKKKYPWIQLVGHQGNFVSGSNGTILKLLCSKELNCFIQLKDDILASYTPTFHGVVNRENNEYVLLEDLLFGFSHPCVMDIKLGVRTYLVEELLKAQKNPELRKDMYIKMIEVDESAPTEEERVLGAVTKARYMKWRETVSSSSTLGFRIEGVRLSNSQASKDFKLLKSIEDITQVLENFLQNNVAIAARFKERLSNLRKTLEMSPFFTNYEVVGSSLLFVYDDFGKANIWMIDFGKSAPLPPDVKINHRSPWVEGNREDGYLFGLDNLISIFHSLHI